MRRLRDVKNTHSAPLSAALGLCGQPRNPERYMKAHARHFTLALIVALLLLAIATVVARIAH